MSPLAWSGATSRTHLHVWAAIVLGGVISLFPAVLALVRPGVPSTRYTIATAQMLMGALLIHLTGGRIPNALSRLRLAGVPRVYRDWRVLVPATIVVAADHFLRGVFWPQSVYGVLIASQWRWVEHAAWVFFEDIFLVVSCLRSVAEMRQRAERTAVLDRRSGFASRPSAAPLATAAVGLALTRGTESQVMFQECAEALVEHLDGGFAGIWTVDQAEAWLEPLAAAGANRPAYGTGPRTRVGDGAIGAIARDRAPRLARGADVDRGEDGRDWIGCEGLAAFAGYPLLLHGKLIGVLAVFAHQESSTARVGRGWRRSPTASPSPWTARGPSGKSRATPAISRTGARLCSEEELAEQLSTLVDQLSASRRNRRRRRPARRAISWPA